MSSPFTKAKAQLEAHGYRVGKTEYWNPWGEVRVDLFGCIDLVALCPLRPLLAVQVTSRTNVSARMKKAHDIAVIWISTGNRFQVIGYGKNGSRTVEMMDTGKWEEVS